MKRPALILTALTALAVALPETADAFRGKRGTRVEQVNNAVFEVATGSAGSGQDYWCGAADYARRALGASWTTDIYIARGRGPGQVTGKKSAVQFTIDPTAAGIAPGSKSFRLGSLRVGDYMSVQSANQYCQAAPDRF